MRHRRQLREDKRRKSKHDGQELTSRIATILLLEVGAFLVLCQLAFFPITLPSAGVQFHSFLLFLPFAAVALYVSLPIFLGCAALIGAILCARVMLLPMDFYEYLFSNPFGTIMSVCLFALLIWAALNGTRRLLGNRMNGAVGTCALVAALFATALVIQVIWHLYLNAIFSMYGYGDYLVYIIGAMWTAEFWAAVVFNWITWLVATLAIRALMRRFVPNEAEPSLRVVFQRWLSLVIVGAFLLTTSIGFLFSSVQALREANDTLTSRVNSIAAQVQDRLDHQQGVEGLVDAYTDAYISTVAIGRDGQTLSTNDESFGDSFEEVLADVDEGIVDDTAQNTSSKRLQFLQDISGIVYYKVGQASGYDIIALARSERIFASRTSVIAFNSLCYLALFIAVFALISKLLNDSVVKGFKRTNKTLALITAGDLEQHVEEHETQEFSALSTGINTTVDALKDLIDEAERRMERDLATAKAIQESALPRTFPPFPEIDAFDIFASMDAAKEVGGDFFDFFLIDEHTLGFLIADVSGKGIPGALFMMAAKAELENHMLEGDDLAQAISKANQILCANNDAGMFVTVWAATLDWTCGELTYVNAGHNFPLLYHGADNKWEWLKKKCGLFLGTFETAKYRQETLVLEPGDRLVLYTDGVNEAFNVNEEEYGNDRLEAFLANHCDEHPRELVRALRGDVASWAKGAEQSDDVTILVLEYTGNDGSDGTAA